MTPTAESLRDAFATGLDAAARIRVRRPGSLFQVELPAYMGDGDVAIYVRPGRSDSLEAQADRLAVDDPLRDPPTWRER